MHGHVEFTPREDFGVGKAEPVEARLILQQGLVKAGQLGGRETREGGGKKIRRARKK